MHVEAGPVVFQGRFHPFNIMHLLHDDVLGLYYLLRAYLPVRPYGKRAGARPQLAEDGLGLTGVWARRLPHGIGSVGRAEAAAAPFSREFSLWFLDPHGAGPYDALYGHFTTRYPTRYPWRSGRARIASSSRGVCWRAVPPRSDRPVRYRADLPATDVTLFRHAIVGQSRRTTWYQYGFTAPQVGAEQLSRQAEAAGT